MSTHICLKNGVISVGKFEKIVTGVCRGFILYGKLLSNPFTDWRIRAYLIRIIGCIWDTIFDLKDVEKTILNCTH